MSQHKSFKLNSNLEKVLISIFELRLNFKRTLTPLKIVTTSLTLLFSNKYNPQLHLVLSNHIFINLGLVRLKRISQIVFSAYLRYSRFHFSSY